MFSCFLFVFVNIPFLKVYDQSNNYKEVVGERTLNLKSFIFSDKLITRYYSNYIQFNDNGKMVDFDNSLVSHDDKYLLKKANYNITIDGYHVVFRIDNNYWYDKLRPGTQSRVFMPANIGPSLVNWEYIFFGNYDIKRYYSNTIFIKVVM